MGEATVADELAFEALPYETRSLIIRLANEGYFLSPSLEEAIKEAERESYDEGYQDGVDHANQDEYDQGYEEGYEAAREKYETPEP